MPSIDFNNYAEQESEALLKGEKLLAPEQVMEHLLKSGAGTAFYEAIDPDRRNALKQDFIQILAAREPSATSFPVVHDYVGGIAVKV